MRAHHKVVLSFVLATAVASCSSPPVQPTQPASNLAVSQESEGKPVKIKVPTLEDLEKSSKSAKLKLLSSDCTPPTFFEIITLLGGGKINGVGKWLEGPPAGAGCALTSDQSPDDYPDGKVTAIYHYVIINNILNIYVHITSTTQSSHPIYLPNGIKDGSYTYGEYLAPSPDSWFHVMTAGEEISETSLSISEPAFSPNGDSRKDTARIKIMAKGPWAISVVGYPGELGGAPTDKTGNKELDWNGTVNGATLPDGKYTLRLTAGSEVKTADVIIDTKKPDIDSLTISNIDTIGASTVEKMEDIKKEYTFKVTANDDSASAVSSGIDTESVELIYKNANFTHISTKQSESNEFDIKSRFDGAPPTSTVLEYSVKVRDRAGNESDQLANTFSAVVEETVRFATKEPGGASAYRIQAAGAPKVKLKDNAVFYVKSGLVGEAEVYLYVKSPTLFTGSFDGLIVNRSPGSIDENKIIAKSERRLTFTANQPVIRTFDWNGRKLNNPTLYASRGLYEVLPANPEPWFPHVVVKTNKFKVSSYECIKRNDYINSKPAPLDMPSSCHILDRHILGPVNIYGKATKKGKGYIHTGTAKPEELFSFYDAVNMSASRPVSPVYYDELYEITNGYPETPKVLATPQSKKVYDWVIAMGDEIIRKPVSDRITVPHPVLSGWEMPVVLPNYEVLWVRAVPLGTGYKTIFPSYGNQQRDENNIQ